jgi:hypothetical protein
MRQSQNNGVASLEADSDGRLQFQGRTYELTLCSGNDHMSLELDDVSGNDRTTLLIGRRMDGGELELLSLQHAGEPAVEPRFLPLELVEFFLRQLPTL